jgi:hypothetical protein
MESDSSQIEHQALKSPHSLSSESYECSSPIASPQYSSGEETAYSGIFKSVNDGIQGKFMKTNSILLHFIWFIF